jgi:hypothetical protein
VPAPQIEPDVCRELQVASAIDTIVKALANKGYLIYFLNERGEFVPIASWEGGVPEN